MSAVTQAIWLVSTDGIPKAICSFYTSFSDAKTFQVKTTSNYTRIIQCIYDVKLCKSYRLLNGLAKKKDPGLIQFLESQGLKTP
jgi:hypothetical protein